MAAEDAEYEVTEDAAKRERGYLEIPLRKINEKKKKIVASIREVEYVQLLRMLEKLDDCMST